MKLTTSMLLSLALVACGEKEPEPVDPVDPVDPLDVDDDGDGFSENQGDCNDDDAAVAPGAEELCDSVDNDCDDEIDEDATDAVTFYADSDADTFGDPSAEMAACEAPDGYVDNMDDCNDADAAINPDAVEVCDTFDNDCDELIDDADDSLDESTGKQFFVDFDGDGEGDPDDIVMACELPEGAVENATDCNDLDAAINNADNDGDGVTSCGTDVDGDGELRLDEVDCDDMNNTVIGIDEDGDNYSACIDDCDDDDAWTNVSMGSAEADDSLCMTDYDQDGYGDMNPVDGVDAGTDCEDTDDSLNPADYDTDTFSTCDGDCDDTDNTVTIVDTDGDGFSGCYVDCDDNDAYTFPGAAENESATECLTDADEDGWAASFVSIGFDCFSFDMADSWGDGWNGNALDVYEDGVMTGSYANTSAASGGEVQNAQHCLDSATTIAEVVFVDGAYNGEVTFDVSVVDAAGTVTFVGSGDGMGLSTSITFDGMEYDDGEAIWSNTREGADCDDSDPSILATDADGDGSYDCQDDCDASDASLNNVDADGDGYTTCGDDDGAYDCDDNDASTTGDDDMDGYYVAGCNDDAAMDDCDDADADSNPGETEIYYNNVDNNCDGLSDFDADMDGDEPTSLFDTNGTEFTSIDFDGDGVDDWTAGTDCDDSDASVEGLDVDADGFATCADADGLSDCDDSDEFTFPGAAELEAGYDVNDPTTWECLTDADDDGYAMGDAAQCYTLTMYDSYGDGWNGNSIDVYVDSVLEDTLEISGFSALETAEVCVVNGSAVEFIWNQGSYVSEISYALTDDAGNILQAAAGGGSWSSGYYVEDSNGVTYGDGEVVYSDTAAGTSSIGGSDPDDSDASIVPQ